MKSFRWIKLIWPALLLLPGLASMGSVAAAPRGEFACQVVAQGGRIGLVMVEAETREAAAQAALGAEAFTTDNLRGRATRVVQCILRGKEQFADYQFQQFYEVVPR